MQLKMLRGHYAKKRGGYWQPKKGFESRAQIKKAGFKSRDWGSYRCEDCGKYHLFDKRKLK